MNEEVNSEIIQNQEEESASDPEVITEGSTADSEVITEVDSEIELEVITEVETEVDTEVETEVDTESVTTKDLEDLKESINSNNESLDAISTILFESSNSETLDYTEVLENTYLDNIKFNNNFCLGVTALILVLGIVSGILVGFTFKEVFRK